MFDNKCATYDDVNLVLHLFELRREEKLRQARQWFAASFHADTMEQFKELCPPGSQENANFRMVVSYWDMVAGFITSGVLNPELFFKSGRELLYVWVRIEALLPAAREAFKDPSYLGELEKVSNDFIASLTERSPDAYEAFRERVLAIGR